MVKIATGWDKLGACSVVFTNLRLSAKALLAMSISFLVHIAWLVAMWNNNMQTQALSVKEKQQASFVETINEFTQLYYQLQAAFFTAFSSVNANDHQCFNSLNTRYTKLLSEIETKPGLVDYQKAVLVELGKFARYQQNLLDDVHNNADEHDWHRFVLYRRQFLKMLRETFDDKRDVKEFLMPQRLELDRLHRNQEHSEKLFVIMLHLLAKMNLPSLTVPCMILLATLKQLSRRNKLSGK